MVMLSLSKGRSSGYYAFKKYIYLQGYYALQIIFFAKKNTLAGMELRHMCVLHNGAADEIEHDPKTLF